MPPLAELEIFHSRPIAPTRRIAVGASHLPTDPAPGPGGVLVGGICARFGPDIDEDLLADVDLLARQVGSGRRIVQPRLRHRFQVDRVGLLTSRHRLTEDRSGGVAFDFGAKGAGLPQVLGAIYAAGRLGESGRRSVIDAARKGLRWSGPLDRGLMAHLSGLDHTADATELGDPVQWAMGILGLTRSGPVGGPARLPAREDVNQRFRVLVRDVHPDHGGDDSDAAHRIAELRRARTILIG